MKGKKTIICIDDFERKSNIDIIDLLGLIERTIQNYNVIVIASTKQFSLEDKNIFDKYREKVIDYEFVINKIDPQLSLSKDIVLTEELYNICIFKKYIVLICKMLQEINNTLKINDYALDNDIIKTCKSVICRYYFPQKFYKTDNKSNKKIKLRDEELIQIFIGATYDIEMRKELVSTDSEIREDIKDVYGAFKLRQEEVRTLFNKVQGKVMLKDLQYFADQHKVISRSDSGEWFDVGFWGDRISARVRQLTLLN